MLIHTAEFQVLGDKLSQLKCEISVLDWSGQIVILIFHDQKIKKLCWNKVAKTLFGLQSESSVGSKWPSQFWDFRGQNVLLDQSGQVNFFTVKYFCWTEVAKSHQRQCEKTVVCCYEYHIVPSLYMNLPPLFTFVSWRTCKKLNAPDKQFLLIACLSFRDLEILLTSNLATLVQQNILACSPLMYKWDSTRVGVAVLAIKCNISRIILWYHLLKLCVSLEISKISQHTLRCHVFVSLSISFSCVRVHSTTHIWDFWHLHIRPWLSERTPRMRMLNSSESILGTTYVRNRYKKTVTILSALSYLYCGVRWFSGCSYSKISCW